MCPHNCFTNTLYVVLRTDWLATKEHKPEESNLPSRQRIKHNLHWGLGLEYSVPNAKVESWGHFIKVMKLEFWSSPGTLLIMTMEPWKKMQWKTSKWKLWLLLVLIVITVLELSASSKASIHPMSGERQRKRSQSKTCLAAFLNF